MNLNSELGLDGHVCMETMLGLAHNYREARSAWISHTYVLKLAKWRGDTSAGESDQGAWKRCHHGPMGTKTSGPGSKFQLEWLPGAPRGHLQDWNTFKGALQDLLRFIHKTYLTAFVCSAEYFRRRMEGVCTLGVHKL